MRFSNVNNSKKLSNALNNVWFGHLRVWAREARFDRFAENDKKPLVVSKTVKRRVEGRLEEKEVSWVNGEGEKRARKGEGVKAVVGRGRSGEGEKSVRVGQVVVSVKGVGGNLKEHRKEKEKEVVSSPVLTKVKDWRPMEGKKKEDVIYLDVDEEGRTTRVTKEEMDQPVNTNPIQLIGIGHGPA